MSGMCSIRQVMKMELTHDHFTVVYKILSALEANMDTGQPNTRQPKTQAPIRLNAGRSDDIYSFIWFKQSETSVQEEK